MLSVRIVAPLFASLLMTGCADTEEEARASDEQKEALSVAGDGMPVPEQLDIPIQWPGKLDVPRPLPKPAIEDLRDPLGPKGDCALTYLTIHDPVRDEPLEIGIVVCN